MTRLTITMTPEAVRRMRPDLLGELIQDRVRRGATEIRIEAIASPDLELLSGLAANLPERGLASVADALSEGRDGPERTDAD